MRTCVVITVCQLGQMHSQGLGLRQHCFSQISLFLSDTEKKKFPVMTFFLCK